MAFDMGSDDKAPKEPKVRPLTPTGFPEPYFAKRETRSLRLETTMDIIGYRPGRRMVGFVSVTALVLGSVAYDRREAKRIQQEYIDQVKHLGQEPVDATTFEPRRIAVYSCKLPGDTEDERGLNWFKRYMKPVLVAAGIDYTYTNGQIAGSLGRILTAKFKAKRLEAEAAAKSGLPYDSPEQSTSAKKLDDDPSGGVVIIGRTAWKEYLWALKRGYLDELNLDREWRIVQTDLEDVEDQELMKRFEKDGYFDEPAPESSQDSTTAPFDSKTGSGLSAPFSAYKTMLSSSTKASKAIDLSIEQPDGESAAPRLLSEAAQLPEQPPISLVPFSHPLGSALWWPLKLYNWLYGERERAQTGGQLALDLIRARSQPIGAQQNMNRSALFNENEAMSKEWTTADKKMRHQPSDPIFQSTPTGWSISDFGLDTEKFLEKTFRRVPARIANIRADYYKELPSKIVKARQAESGELETSPDEKSTVAEVYRDRLRQEKRWGREEQGWRVTRPGSGITWDDRFDGVLRTFERSTTHQGVDPNRLR